MRRCEWMLGMLGMLLFGCARAVDPPAPSLNVAAAPGSASAPVASTSLTAAAPPAPVASNVNVVARYPWLAARGDALGLQRLESGFAAPWGYTRVELAEGSFGAWLRGLPLERFNAPVVSYRGTVLLPGDHRHIAGVVAIDVGAQDLQQCADSIIRLHAEWLWSKGRRDQSYRAASGAAMPFARWALGERVTASGPGGSTLTWAPKAHPDESHQAFRSYLDAVFGWANTGSLARDTRPIALADLQPGDFVVQPGGPGHAVLILDLAIGPDGRRVALLGQGFMPAQSFQVLHPGRPNPHVTPGPPGNGAWFAIDEAGLETPFWPRFAWTTLHRFPEG